MPKNVMCDCVSEPSFGTGVFDFYGGLPMIVCLKNDRHNYSFLLS